MKKLFVLAVALLIGSTALMAQNVTKKFIVENMHCKNCALAVEKLISSVDGVKSVDVDLQTKEVSVEYDAKKVSEDKLVAPLANTKFKVVTDAKKECCKEKKEGENASQSGCCKDKNTTNSQKGCCKEKK